MEDKKHLREFIVTDTYRVQLIIEELQSRLDTSYLAVSANYKNELRLIISTMRCLRDDVCFSRSTPENEHFYSKAPDFRDIIE